MQVTEQSLHTLYVWKLSKELSKRYDRVLTNVPIPGQRRMLGEIDILAARGDELHAFEVKRSFRPVKARLQLKKAQENFSEPISRFFLYAADADLILEVHP